MAQVGQLHATTAQVVVLDFADAGSICVSWRKRLSVGNVTWGYTTGVTAQLCMHVVCKLAKVLFPAMHACELFN
jgi:hypothetical protein